jgi:predicted small metal-binding protein
MLVHMVDHKSYLFCDMFIIMAKKFACGDVISGCSWSTTANDENGLFQKISEHAKIEHNMTSITN